MDETKQMEYILINENPDKIIDIIGSIIIISTNLLKINELHDSRDIKHIIDHASSQTKYMIVELIKIFFPNSEECEHIQRQIHNTENSKIISSLINVFNYSRKHISNNLFQCMIKLFIDFTYLRNNIEMYFKSSNFSIIHRINIDAHDIIENINTMNIYDKNIISNIKIFERIRYEKFYYIDGAASSED